MTEVAGFFFVVGYVVVSLLLVGLVAWMVWYAWDLERDERVRTEREVADASWQIHKRATQAFGEMLQAARESEDEERNW